MRWIRWGPTAIVLSGVLLLGSALSCNTTKTETAGSASHVMTAEEKIARGLYLSHICGCNDCHTPGTFYGSPDTTRVLSGGELGWTGPWGTTYPRNLTPDSTGLAAWTDENIVAAIRTGHRPDGSPILPPMPWPTYSHLSDEDAFALAAYLKSLPPVHHRPPDRLPPGKKAPAALVFPPPPAWDAQNLPPPPASGTPTN